MAKPKWLGDEELETVGADNPLISGDFAGRSRIINEPYYEAAPFEMYEPEPIVEESQEIVTTSEPQSTEAETDNPLAETATQTEAEGTAVQAQGKETQEQETAPEIVLPEPVDETNNAFASIAEAQQQDETAFYTGNPGEDDDEKNTGNPVYETPPQDLILWGEKYNEGLSQGIGEEAAIAYANLFVNPFANSETEPNQGNGVQSPVAFGAQPVANAPRSGGITNPINMDFADNGTSAYDASARRDAAASVSDLLEEFMFMGNPIRNVEDIDVSPGGERRFNSGNIYEGRVNPGVMFWDNGKIVNPREEYGTSGYHDTPYRDRTTEYYGPAYPSEINEPFDMSFLDAGASATEAARYRNALNRALMNNLTYDEAVEYAGGNWTGIDPYHNPEEDNLSPAEIAWRDNNNSGTPSPFYDEYGAQTMQDYQTYKAGQAERYAEFPENPAWGSKQEPSQDQKNWQIVYNNGLAQGMSEEEATQNAFDYIDEHPTNPVASPEYVEPAYGAMTTRLWNDLYASLPDTMSGAEKAEYVERMMNGEGWNYEDAMFGVLPDDWAVPWVDETDNTFSPALQYILDQAKEKDVITVRGDDGQMHTVERNKPQDPFHWLSLFIDPDASEGGSAFRFLENVPEECYELLASSARNGDSTSFLYGRDLEYFNGTDYEYNQLAQLFVSSVPALRVMIANDIISMDDVIRFFFKAPKSQKPKGGVTGAGGYRGYYGGGGGGGYIGGGGKQRTQLPTPTGTKQQQNRVYNIMKNWSF